MVSSVWRASAVDAAIMGTKSGEAILAHVEEVVEPFSNAVVDLKVFASAPLRCVSRWSVALEPVSPFPSC